MTLDSAVFFAALFVAHLFGDFLLQSPDDDQGKRSWPSLLRHSAVLAAIGYILAARWEFWAVPAVVFASHAMIDALTARPPSARSVRLFVVDQLAHFGVIVGLSVFVSLPRVSSYFGLSPAMYLQGLIVAAGAVMTVWAGGAVVGLLVAPYREKASPAGGTGIPGAGQLIGQLERLLILILFLAGIPTAIGLLIAAKSVFRFGETSDPANRQAAEYIIIGTLLSFAVGSMAALLTVRLLGWASSAWPL